MFILDRSIPACREQHLGIGVVQRLNHGRRMLQVVDLSREGLVSRRNHILERSAGLVERPLRIHDYIVGVNGEESVVDILAMLTDFNLWQLFLSSILSFCLLRCQAKWSA